MQSLHAALEEIELSATSDSSPGWESTVIGAAVAKTLESRIVHAFAARIRAPNLSTALSEGASRKPSLSSR